MSILKVKSSTLRSLAQTMLLLLWSTMAAWAGEPKGPSSQGTNIFAPASTPAKSIADLSVFVLVITGIIFLVVFALLVYSVVKFRGRAKDAGREPAQVYGSTQIELAWTIIPILIVVVLFLATARIIHAIQDAQEPADAIQVTAIGHQYWWEFRYPRLGIVTANELHIPVSDPSHPTPTECGWTHSGQVYFLASAPNTAEHSTPRCYFAFLWILRRISRPGFAPSRVLPSKTQAPLQAGESLKAMPA